MRHASHRRLLSAGALWLALGLAGCGSDNPTGPEGPEPPMNLDPFEQNQRLGRGINLGNALEAPNEGEWGVVLQERYFDLIKNAGFQSVRIPIRWSAHTASTPPYTIESDLLRRVDWAIEQALSRGLLAIINIHHFDEIMQRPADEKARFLAIWQQLGERYRNHPGDLLFELLNEPNGNLSPSVWNTFLSEAIAVIRASNPGRTLICGPAVWNSFTTLEQLQLPANDRNIIATFHYYNPFFFTHQGAEWVPGSDAWLGTAWNRTEAEQQAIIRDFAVAVNWAQANNRPLNLGEFGAYSKADMQSRALWTAFVARLAEQHGISWHYWEFIAGFGAYDGDQNAWRMPLLQALVPPTL